MNVAWRAALLLTSMLAVTAFAQQPQLTSAQITERLNEWDQAYARLKREIWNLQRGTSMFGRDFRGRMLSDDLRDYALTKSTEKRLNEQRALAAKQLEEGDTQLATETLLRLYGDLRDELEGLDRIGEHRVRYRQVAQQRGLWQQLANTLPNYRTPDSIRQLEQQAVEQLNAGRFDQTSHTTYPALLNAYAAEREGLFRSGAKLGQPIIYERRSPCIQPAKITTDKAIPSLASTTQPIYPSAAKRAGEEGTVHLQVLADSNGCAQQYAIQFSSGWPDLDDAAIEWLESLQFVPAAKDGKAIDAWVTLPVVFHLQD